MMVNHYEAVLLYDGEVLHEVEPHFAGSEADALEAAEAHLQRIVALCGSRFHDLYPNLTAWEIQLRTHD